ncbi:hypothetical protein N3K66_008394 [Trichothecium roseum]|uniref:Uncharacterized protein n=1 Tax=Trichothecium roseum TaxID=47278 RepID=A0ACC0USK8_9HYPO|nr:hypothetical protein N3K66_008394 [Trichothecium roseum]
MLAPHRDLEHLMHGHQGPTKQHPKTPMRFGQRDENAPATVAGKTAIGGARVRGNENVMMTKGRGGKQAVVTPIGQGARAPLGNKTTNAKARTGQAGGVQGTEKTQLKPTAQKPKQKAPEILPARIEVKHDTSTDVDEPEYAPPPSKALPYESDILPEGGLTFEGLKKENILKGFYEHFINPVDENGVSKRDRQFADEMRVAMTKAIAKNEQDLNELDWGFGDRPTKVLTKKPDGPDMAVTKMARKVRGASHQKQPSAVSSRRAAIALAAPPDLRTVPPKKASIPTIASKRPMTSLAQRPKSAKIIPSHRPTTSMSGAGEAASRTTIGYSKGKAASSALHARSRSQSTLGGRQTRSPVPSNDSNGLTTASEKADDMELGQLCSVRPSFMSIFDEEEDEELPPLNMPPISDDEDEEFELKLEI